MTVTTLDAAKGTSHKDEKGDRVSEPQPAYYLLVPITVAGDIVTLPCQLLLGWLVKASCNCM